MTLNDLANSSGCDKGSNGHNYAWLYELLFRNLPSHPKILEIGVYLGHSLRTWVEYFNPAPRVIGIDVRDWGAKVEGAVIMIANAYTLGTVDFGIGAMSKFDLIIDDGSHEPEDQKFVLTEYSKHLEVGGLLIIEDLRDGARGVLCKDAVPLDLDYCFVDMGRGRYESRLFLGRKKAPL